MPECQLASNTFPDAAPTWSPIQKVYRLQNGMLLASLLRLSQINDTIMNMGGNSGASGIRFNDCIFSEPVNLAEWTPPGYAGLFAVLVSDANWAPRSFQPLYFGEFGNNSPLQALFRQFAAVAPAVKGRALYVSVLPLPFSTTHQRWNLRNELIWAYNPECQAGIALPHGASAMPFSDLDPKQRDQNAEFTTLLANFGHTAPSVPERPRRRIGFAPEA